MSEYVLQMKNIVKSYSGVKVLKGVDLELRKGEILGLVGENGAGKSTLMKILSGGTKPDEGSILIDGDTVQITDPIMARQLKICMVQQELSLINTLSIRDNIVLGNENRRGFFRTLDQTEHRKRAVDALKLVDLDLDVDQQVGKVSVAYQQMIEIARNLANNPRVLVLDEPTTALTMVEAKVLLEKMVLLRKSGASIIFISHKLEEIMSVSDRLLVLRDGERVANLNAGEVTRAQLIYHMVGDKALHKKTDRTLPADAKECLRVTDLSRKGLFNNVSFHLREGEVLGVFGLKGAGRSEVAMSIFGALKHDKGTVEIPGVKEKTWAPRSAIRHGIGFLTEDRKATGIFPNCSLRENISIVDMRRVLDSLGRINRKTEENAARRFIGELNIKAFSSSQKVKNLSGGNQQKVIIGRWLFNDSKVLILDEPTKGVDIGAKQEIYQQIEKLADAGRGILLISSELDEIMALSDRILIMRAGEVTAEFGKNQATYKEIMHYAAG
ncbi:MAG TPA: sugar ABC transporter ATP-binding protein [Rectinemataceae bacterium]|nr:sugar ABC transporter ATP-binding protein [Rectinemataceae bacterium]